MKKIPRFNIPAWVIGIVLIALGVVFMTKSDFGVSSIVAPAYVIHLKVSQYLPWYTFGTSEYILQGFLLLVMCAVIRRFRLRYLLSFVTSVIYGEVLDLWFMLFGTQPYTEMRERCVSFVAGILISSLAIAFLFRTRLPQQVYELFVKEVSIRYKLRMNKFKLAYDLSSLAVAAVLALILSRSFNGVGVGTIICAVVNAPLIAMFGKVLDKVFDFEVKTARR